MRAESIFGAFIDIIYPRFCASCGKKSDVESRHICWECFSSFELVRQPYCETCGDPVEGAVSSEYQCSMCRRKTPGYDRARSVFRYRGRMCDIVQNFKYRQSHQMRDELAGYLLAGIREYYPKIKYDVVVPVPLFGKRLRERNYNQAGLLASCLAKKLEVEFEPECLQRVRDTSTQTHLDASKRKDNVKGAFAVKYPRWVAGRRFLLVDDVMTTGATVNECAKELKDNDAVSVHVITLARG